MARGAKRPKMRVSTIAVTWPTCNAPPGQSCGGNFMGRPNVHPRRLALAGPDVSAMRKLAVEIGDP